MRVALRKSAAFALATTILAVTPLAAQEPTRFFYPWIGGAVSLGAGGAGCMCNNDFRGLLVGHLLTVGADLSPTLAVGFERHSAIPEWDDDRNRVFSNMAVVRYKPARFLGVSAGLGSATYRLGARNLVDNKPAILLGGEIGGGKGVQFTAFADVVASAGDTDPTLNGQFSILALYTGIGMRIRLRGW